MRPMTPEQAIRATQITSRYGPVHGAPVHVGEPERDRHRRPRRARLRRPGRGPRRRAAGVLGLRRDAPGGRGRLAAGADDHPRAGAHVRDRRAGRDDGDALAPRRCAANVNGGLRRAAGSGGGRNRFPTQPPFVRAAGRATAPRPRRRPGTRSSRPPWSRPPATPSPRTPAPPRRRPRSRAAARPRARSPRYSGRRCSSPS